MPYTVAPARIKGLPKHAQDIWVATYNSAIKQYKGDEGRANATAWSAIEKVGYSKIGEKWSKNEGETTASSLDPEGITQDSQSKSSKKNKRVITMKKMSKFEKWTTKYKNSLPDSAFAFVDGNIRKLPYKDATGKVDIPHLRNALVRVSQGKTELNPTQRAKALITLQKVAKKYLKSYQTKSGEIMKATMSKFQATIVDKLASIIDTLKAQATGRKPTERVEFEVKAVSLLIQDMEDVIEYEKQRELELSAPVSEPVIVSEPPKIDPIVVETPKEAPLVEEKKELPVVEPAKPEVVKEEESKFQELLDVCEGYKQELETANGLIKEQMSKLSELESKNTHLAIEMSKFREENYANLVENTVQRVSKFRNLTNTEANTLKETWMVSKMSESALAEIGRKTDEQIMSKLSEPKETTKLSVLLDPVFEDVEISKMSSQDKLTALANLNAKRKGFVL